jgi:hypothetical protein
VEETSAQWTEHVSVHLTRLLTDQILALLLERVPGESNTRALVIDFSNSSSTVQREWPCH